MPVTAPRTTKPATSPARRSTRASSAAAATRRTTVPPPTIVKGPPGPAIKLGNAAAAKDPRFNRVIEKLEKSSAKVKEHVPPARKAAEAQAAAQPPANEKLAGAKANQVDTMKGAETKKPDPDSFLTLLRAEIEKIMPKTLGDTENFMEGDQKGQLKGAMTGNINQQKEEASGDIKAASSQEPDPSTVEGKEVTPLPADEATSAPPAIGAAEAVPTAKPENEVSLQKSKQDADQQLKDAEVTPGQLQEANDPRFSAVLTAKSAVGKQADSAPQQYRSSEQKTLTQEAAKAVGDEKQGIIAFQHEKGKSGVAVKLKQLSAKQKDEARRKEVTDTIEKIYNETKQTVETKLASLETDVSSLFDAGIEAAMTKMKNSIDKRMDAYKDERYDVIGGSLLWAHDKLFGMPDEVNVFYEDGRKLFMKELDTLVVNIAKVVETRLKEAKDEIAKGQKRINDYVQSLPKDLQAVGKAAEKDVAYRFEDLSRSIDDKKNALAQKLAQRYKEATNKANEQLKEMQEENKGLVTKFIEKLGEIIKILREFKERISAMLKKGWETIKLIVAHPIRFLGNLITAIKMGVQQFSTNILKHLEEGLMNWLFGSLAEAGIEIPPDLSLGSILKLVLQVLGLTYDRIRAKAVKLIGAGNVMLLEKAWQFISTLIKGGPAALWEQIKEFLGNLKEMITKAIQDWIVEGVIRAAIKKLVLMFNPVGAIIGAIMAIYDTVMFFIERINQILAFVEAIINSVYKIATGDVSTAAKWIENALAKAIPIIISFFARFLGLTGIAEKIKETIKKIQDTVDKALDKLIEKAVAGVGKLFGKGKAEKPDERTPEQKQKDLDQAMAEGEKVLEDENKSPQQVKKELVPIKAKYRVATLEVITDSTSESEETDHIHGENSPGKDGRKVTKKKGKHYSVSVSVYEDPNIKPKDADPKESGASHHVPVKVLAIWVGKLYQMAGRAKALDNKELREKGKELAENTEGTGLSAIWLSKTDHKEAAHAPGTEEELDELKAKEREIEVYTKGDESVPSVKPFQTTITRAVHEHEVGDESTTEDPEKQMKEIVKKIITIDKLQSLVKKVYYHLLAAGIVWVQRVFEDKKQKEEVDTELRKKAKDTWKDVHDLKL